jgi:uncharacterized membrane protein (DUF373 family)
MKRRTKYRLAKTFSDQAFLQWADRFETFIVKVLLIAIIFITIYAAFDLIVTLLHKIWTIRPGSLGKTLISIFGLFLNLLIALELMENITGYLKKHVFQVELVILTAIIAVARKLVILDLDKTSGMDLIGLAAAIVGLAIGYSIIRVTNRSPRNDE